MIRNIDINWDVFDYKFRHGKREAFEDLSTILFCYEYNIKNGLFRYLNQPYIETMPISYNEGKEYIGFQAKYYDATTKISDRKQDLIKTIEGMKEKYPKITKLLIYTNKELSSSSKKNKVKPEYQKEIEQFGSKMGVNIEWRVKSNFEIMLTHSDLEHVRDYFFNPDPGLKEYFNEIQTHTQSNLKKIHSSINYGDNSLKFKREIQDFKNSQGINNEIIIVHGEGGSGKSGFVKDLLKDEKGIINMFKATELDTATIAEFSKRFGEYNFRNYLEAVKDETNKICFIDSAEKAFLLKNTETFQEVIDLLLKYNWKIIITIRTLDKDNFISNYLQRASTYEIFINKLSIEELKSLLNGANITLPSEENYLNLLCNLFYLSLYIEIITKNEYDPSSMEQFIKSVWEQKVRGSNKDSELDIRRENTLMEMMIYCANKDIYYFKYRSNIDIEALSALKEDDIIYYDDVMRGYSWTHDIYEEIILSFIFTDKFKDMEETQDFFDEFETSLLMTKNFKLWLRELMSKSEEKAKNFIYEVLSSDAIAPEWVDEILVTLLGLDEESFSTNDLELMLIRKDFIYLFRAVTLLNTVGKKINYDFWDKIFTQEEKKNINLYRVTKPTGPGWNKIINIIHNNIEVIKWDEYKISQTVECLKDWTTHNERGDSTKHAGLLALRLYEKIHTSKPLKYRIGKELIANISNIILSSSWELDSELREIVDKVLNDDNLNYDNIYYEFCIQVLKNIHECGSFPDSHPDLVFALAKKHWLLTKNNSSFVSSFAENEFGINDSTRSEYSASSAFQTPIFRLLQSHPQRTIEFITQFMNEVTKNLIKNYEQEYNEKFPHITIYLPNGEKNKQIASPELWVMHRGLSQSSPKLLESILMALEKWLLIVVRQEENIPENLWIKLLSSNSVALTSVVVSIIEACPDKLFDISCALLRTKEIFILDRVRHNNERFSNLMRGFFLVDKSHDEERKQTNKEKFRELLLENIIFEYQIEKNNLTAQVFTERRKIIHDILDEVYKEIKEYSPSYQRLYYNMDARRLKPDPKNAYEKNGQTYIPLSIELPSSLVENQYTINEKEDDIKYLFMWAGAHFNQSEDRHEYQYNLQEALDKAKSMWVNTEDEIFPLAKLTCMYVFGIVVRDHLTTISTRDCKFCVEIIMEFIEGKTKHKIINHDFSQEFEVAISVLPFIISSSRVSEENLKKANNLMLSLILNANSKALEVFRNHLWTNAPKVAEVMVIIFIKLIRSYNEQINTHTNLSPLEFIKENQSLINSTRDVTLEEVNDFSDLDYQMLLNLSLLLPANERIFREKVLQIGKLTWPILFLDNKQRYKKDMEFLEEEIEYINWLADYLMGDTHESQKILLIKMSPYINASENFDLLLKRIVYLQDISDRRDKFWNIWHALYPRVLTICKETEKEDKDISKKEFIHITNKIVKTYSLGLDEWDDNKKSWHGLKEKDHLFFADISKDFGFKTTTLYSISRVLNTIGYNYLQQGINWLYDIIHNNPHLQYKNLEMNTKYYIEEYMQRFINKNEGELKKNSALRNKVITVLNFLVKHSSEVAYMMINSLL